MQIILNLYWIKYTMSQLIMKGQTIVDFIRNGIIRQDLSMFQWIILSIKLYKNSNINNQENLSIFLTNTSVLFMANSSNMANPQIHQFCLTINRQHVFNALLEHSYITPELWIWQSFQLSMNLACPTLNLHKIQCWKLHTYSIIYTHIQQSHSDIQLVICN